MSQPHPSPGPLAGLRVVELSAIGPAPFCAMMLADMGAEILRIAPPKPRGAKMPLPEDRDPIFRGRSVLKLDLKDPAAIETVLGILPQADVLIEGYRPGVLERLGLGPDRCLAANPRLVIGRVTGWGQTGPLADRAGHDANYLALTGALYAMGPGDRPPPPPLNLVGDFGGGAMFLLSGVLAALLHARATGQGQVVDAAMIDGVAALMGPTYGLRNAGLFNDTRGADFMNGGCPFAATYETADGGYLSIMPLEEPFYAAFLDGLGPDADGLPDRANPAHWPALGARLSEIFLTRSRDDWMARFDGTDACVAPILSLAEAPLHPHNVARGTFTPGQAPYPAPAPRFSATATALAPMSAGPAEDLLRRWAAGPA